MNLKSSKIKNIIKKSIFGLIALLVGGFFLKIAIWENHYISEKTGSERKTVSAVEKNESEVDETEITEAEIAEYSVPANQPKYLTINSIGVTNARILSVGTKPSGELDTPINIFDVGWYNQSSIPGGGKVMVLDGHNGGPTKVGVFKYLPNVNIGEKIIIERGDGQLFTYTVKENVTVPLSESNAYMKTAFKTPEAGKESLSIITCTGDWSQTQQTYLSRQFLRATLDN